MSAASASEIQLTYLISTRNKLRLLEQVVQRLLAQMRADEELIITDAGSTDGTAEYIRRLHEEGKVYRYLSERDKGEAHGFNKGLFLSRGKLIKIITDDDVFSWSGIHECRQFMLDHPEVDVMGGNVAHIIYERPDNIVPVLEYERDYRRWLTGELKRTRFSGLPLMLRKSSLPLTGLFFPGIIPVDFEFTLRVTGVANVAWFTGILAIRIDNADSNYRVYSGRALEEVNRISALHQWVESKQREQSYLTQWWRRSRFWVGVTRRKLATSLTGKKQKAVVPAVATPLLEPAEIFHTCDQWLNDYNRKHKGEFLMRQG